MIKKIKRAKIDLNWFKALNAKFDNISARSGVYIISVLLENGRYGAIYVGQSFDIQRRVKAHFSEDQNLMRLKNI